VLSYFNDVLFAKPCPKCQISIFKDGGCDLVTCTNCSHKFWWFCQGTHSGGKKSQSENCVIPRVFTPLMVICSLLMLACHLWHSVNEDTHEKMLKSMNNLSEIVSNLMLFLVFFILLGVEIVMICWAKIESTEDIKESGKLIKIGFAIGSVIYPVIWAYNFHSCFIAG